MAGSRSPNDGLQRESKAPGGRDWVVCDEADAQPPDMSSPEGLALIVEHEIVPRLMMIHQTAGMVKVPDAIRARPVMYDARTVRTFVKLLLAHDASAVSTFVIKQLKRGKAPSALCLGLLAPAARHLGTLWEDDTLDFVEVTLALQRLHALLAILRVPAEIEPGDGGRNILLVPTPGDSHVFGRAVVGEFFRASGWLVEGEAFETRAEIEDAVAGRKFAIVGFSLGSEVLCAELRSLIEAVKLRSLNGSVAILVGGPVFSAMPDRVAEVGADGWAADAAKAVALAESLVMRQQIASGGRG